MGEPSWASYPIYDTALGRKQHRGDLEEQLGQWTSSQEAQRLAEQLQEHGVAAGAALTAEELVCNTHLQERGYFQEFRNEHAPWVGPRMYAGRPFRIPQIPAEIRHVAALGEHNAQILRELAGLSDEEIEGLARDGIIANRPKPNEPTP